MTQEQSATLHGIPGSSGYAIGRAIVIDTRRSGVVRRHVPETEIESEIARFNDGVVRAAQSEEDREAFDRSRVEMMRAYADRRGCRRQ